MEISDAQARYQPTTLFDSCLRHRLQEEIRHAVTLEMYWYLVEVELQALPGTTEGILIAPEVGDSAA